MRNLLAVVILVLCVAALLRVYNLDNKQADEVYAACANAGGTKAECIMKAEQTMSWEYILRVARGRGV